MSTNPLTELSELLGTAKVRYHNATQQIAAGGSQDVTQHLPTCLCDECDRRPRRRARGTSPKSGFLVSDHQATIVDLDSWAKRAARDLEGILHSKRDDTE